MKRSLSFFLLIWILNPTLLAQWEFLKESSDKYECLLFTTTQSLQRDGIECLTTTEDTVFLDVQRKITHSDKNSWKITYNILRRYENGLVKNDKSTLLFSALTDNYGEADKKVFSTAQTSSVNLEIFNYLKFTLIPFPKEVIKKGYRWVDSIAYERMAFTVLDEKIAKLGKECFRIKIQSTSSNISGELFLEQNSGQLIFLDFIKSTSKCKNCTGNKYRMQFSLNESTNIIASNLKYLNFENTELARLLQKYQWIVPLKYNQIQSKSNEVEHKGYIVDQNGYYGWYNDSGKIILPATQNVVESISGHLMQAASKHNIFVIDTTGKILIDSLDYILYNINFEHAIPPLPRKDCWVFMEPKGHILYSLPKTLYNRFYSNVVDGKAIASLEDGKAGLICKDSVIIPLRFTFFKFIEKDLISAHRDTIAFFFDLKGRERFSRKGGAIEAIFGDFIQIKGEGLYNRKAEKLISSNKGFGFIDRINDSLFMYHNTDEENNWMFTKNGMFLGKFKQLYRKGDSLIKWSGGLIPVESVVPGYGGIINQAGEWVVKPHPFKIGNPNGNYYTAYSQDQKVALFSLDGTLLLPFGLNPIYGIGFEKFMVNYPDKKGVFEPSKNMLTPLPQGLTLEDILYYADKAYLVVKQGDKIGLLDSNFNEIVPLEFSKIGKITRYGVIVEAHGKWGVIKRP